MSRKKPTKLRVFPDNWLYPFDFSSCFPHPENPLEVDIGSGKGRFLAARSGRFPDVNFLGVERLLGRLNRSGRLCERLGRENVRLLRMEAYYAVKYLFLPESVNVFYFFFPDPWPKAKHRDHRLFNASFMDALHRALKPCGLLHVATDHLPYFEEIRGLLEADSRFATTDPFIPVEEERTDFELMFARKEVGRYSCRKV